MAVSSKSLPGLEKKPGESQTDYNNRLSKRRYYERAKNDPELRARKRAANRRWARNRSPEARRRWNLHNKERRRGHVHDPEWDQVLRADPCAYCGGQSESVDHIVPILEGGTTEWVNLAGACIRCNTAKHTKSLLEYLLARS